MLQVRVLSPRLMKRSFENLSHFKCDSCDKWWCIGDAPVDKKEWWCPWCGTANVEFEEPKVDPHKVVADALGELDELFKKMGDEFKKKFNF